MRIARVFNWGNLHDADGLEHQTEERGRRHLGEEQKPDTHRPLDRPTCDDDGAAAAAFAAGTDVPDNYQQYAQEVGCCSHSRQVTGSSETESAMSCARMIHATWSLQDEQKEVEQPNRRTQHELQELRQAPVDSGGTRIGHGSMEVVVNERDGGEEAPHRSQWEKKGPDRVAKRRGLMSGSRGGGGGGARSNPLRAEELERADRGAEGGNGGGGNRVPH
nr:unnamed protein product [Digitaria exilis]CAB3469900.1 unnamed protein product [Digitaria exilis]